MNKTSGFVAPRHEAGTVGKQGGRFKTYVRGHGDVALFDLDPERADALRAGEFVPAAATATVDNQVDTWWDRGFVTAEHGTYPKLPDDWTPGGTKGHALSGGRRTHRRTYKGAGVELRMPSVTAIRSFAAEAGAATFDVPVSASFPGGTVQGWVRVTPQRPGEWSVSGLGMDPEASAYVSEAVSAVLEARTPSVALAATDDLMARRRRRFAQGGVKLQAPNNKSQFISGVGYNRDAGTMAVVMGKRSYTYQVPEHVFNMVKNAASPGQVYNLLIKGKTAHGAPVVACDRCGRFSAAAVGHRCPSFHHDAPAVAPETNTVIRAHAAARV